MPEPTSPMDRVERIERKAYEAYQKTLELDRTLLEHMTQSTGQWGEQRRCNDRLEAMMTKHEERIDKVESWQDKAGVKFLAVVAVIVFLGNVLASIIGRVLTP